MAFVDARESITGLKISAGGGDFFSKLREWLGQFQKISGIPSACAGPTSVPQRWILPEAEVQLLRIIQETLSNVRKHSGASRVQIKFAFTVEQVIVTVADNGRGFDPEAEQNDAAKFGLRIIRERAAGIEGTCEVNSVPGQGTVVIVEIPLLHTA